MEFEARTDERGYALIANFKGGYASGWRMAVSESYKDALDIKLTPRIFKGKKEMLWTQGRVYDFHVGDVIHDCEAAYGDWVETLKMINVSVQIISASPCGYLIAETLQTNAKELEVSVQKGRASVKSEFIDGLTIRRLRLDHGVVRFRVLRPDSERTKLIETQILECSQDDFIAFLQTGLVRTAENLLIDLFSSQLGEKPRTP